MFQSAGRLTLYGLISSLDVDLRDMFQREVLAEHGLAALASDVQKKIRERALKDGVTDEGSFYEYLDMGDALGALRKNSREVTPPIQKFLKRHGSIFDKLLPVRNRIMHARPILLSDYSVAEAAAKSVRELPKTLFPITREFDDRVRKDPHHVFSLEMTAITRDEDRVPNNLPLPEYDETGFIGRDVEKEELKKLCTSQWPVITVVGEGGYGKTALALQVAYDILDDDDQDFDAIVWTTAKRIRLTLNDIESIEGAISSSLGIIQVAADELVGSKETPDPVEEVVNYLNTFKVLLVIDNLETILDPLLVEFLRKLNGNSKVLTTSRVGVGELSYSFPLKQMELKDAVRLLRNTARARRVDDLSSAKNEALEAFCAKMKLNAGFIKWFVTCVQYGKRPSEVLADPKVFLDFCVSYVYEHVSDDAKLITKAMLAASGKQSLSLISYLTGLSGDRLELALASLQSANILKMSTSFGELGSETLYELSELPRLYILKNHPPAREEDANFKKRKREVVALFDRLQVESNVNKYSPLTIACRTPSDSVSAKLLIEAQDLTRAHRFDEALERVKQAATLDPSFHEVYRVEAYVYFWAENYIAAEEAYEAAIAYEPGSAPLRYWYGGFLLRGAHDPARARVQFAAAIALDPSNMRINVELARADMHLGEYENASTCLEAVFKAGDLPLKFRRIAVDTFAQNGLRWAQRDLTHGDYSHGLLAIEHLVNLLGDMPEEWLDDRILRTIAPMNGLIDQLAYKCGGEEAWATAKRLSESVCALRGENFAPGKPCDQDDAVITSTPDHSRHVGRVVKIIHERKFGFIERDASDSLFFHFSELKQPTMLYLGCDVTYEIGQGPDGRPAAVKIVIPSHAFPFVPVGLECKGTLKVRHPNFGFIFGSDGRDYFFHTKSLAKGVKWHDLGEGSALSFRSNRTERGLVAEEVRIVDEN